MNKKTIMPDSSPSHRRRVIVLGSTGSVGQSTIKLLKQHHESFEVVGLVAHRNTALLAEQACEVKAQHVVVVDAQHESALREQVKARIAHPSGVFPRIASGAHAVQTLLEEPCDVVVSAIVGTAGLRPSWQALKPGRILALANKECLVAAGDLFMQQVKRVGATLIPVDSEHNALAQILAGRSGDPFQKLILTASGGPFRTFSLDRMREATPAQAIQHPNWRMGPKISVDSATLMNKGLELIEAAVLFDCAPTKIDVLIHPQSLVHALVEYPDGSVLASLSRPDMRVPLSYALGWPSRLSSGVAAMDWSQSMTFEPVDAARFPAVNLARATLHSGGAHLTILNAANEVVVDWFLKGRIGFLDILPNVERALDLWGASKAPQSLDDVLSLDEECRARLRESHPVTVQHR